MRLGESHIRIQLYLFTFFFTFTSNFFLCINFYITKILNFKSIVICLIFHGCLAIDRLAHRFDDSSLISNWDVPLHLVDGIPSLSDAFYFVYFLFIFLIWRNARGCYTPKNLCHFYIWITYLLENLSLWAGSII